VTYGAQSCKVWKEAQGKWESKMCIHGETDTKKTPRAFECCAETGRDASPELGSVIMGANTGTIYCFSNTGERTWRIEKAHERAVQAIVRCSGSAGCGWATGGADGRVHLWDPEMKGEPMRTIVISDAALSKQPMAADVKRQCGGVRSLAVSPESQLYVGTTDNQIFSCELAKVQTPAELEKEQALTYITGGHRGELWGLATHPRANICVTASDDKTIRCWDTVTRKELPDKMIGVPYKPRCLDFNPDGTLLAVGFLDGPQEGVVPIRVHNYKTFQVVAEIDDCEEYVACVKFSPNGQFLAAGSWDQRVYLYDAKNNFKLNFVLQGNTSSVEHLNFTADSEVIMSNSKDTQILYWEVATGARINRQSMLRDAEWAQWTCPLGWHVLGIWDPNYDQTDVNSVCQSMRGDVVAIGDDYGGVKLLRFPSVIEESDSHSYGGHSAHVTCTRFSFDDQHLMSTGGLDTAIMQWRFHSSEQEGAGTLKKFKLMTDHTSSLAKMQTILLLWQMEHTALVFMHWLENIEEDLRAAITAPPSPMSKRGKRTVQDTAGMSPLDLKIQKIEAELDSLHQRSAHASEAQQKMISIKDAKLVKQLEELTQEKSRQEARRSKKSSDVTVAAPQQELPAEAEEAPKTEDNAPAEDTDQAGDEAAASKDAASKVDASVTPSEEAAQAPQDAAESRKEAMKAKLKAEAIARIKAKEADAAKAAAALEEAAQANASAQQEADQAAAAASKEEEEATVAAELLQQETAEAEQAEKEAEAAAEVAKKAEEEGNADAAHLAQEAKELQEAAEKERREAEEAAQIAQKEKEEAEQAAALKAEAENAAKAKAAAEEVAAEKAAAAAVVAEEAKAAEEAKPAENTKPAEVEASTDQPAAEKLTAEQKAAQRKEEMKAKLKAQAMARVKAKQGESASSTPATPAVDAGGNTDASNNTTQAASSEGAVAAKPAESAEDRRAALKAKLKAEMEARAGGTKTPSNSAARPGTPADPEAAAKRREDMKAKLKAEAVARVKAKKT